MSYFIPPHVRSLRNDGGIVLLNLRSGAYFTLNAVGALVWEQLLGGSSRETALDALGRRFPVPRERLERDVDPLLDRLITKGLLGRGDAPLTMEASLDARICAPDLPAADAGGPTVESALALKDSKPTDPARAVVGDAIPGAGARFTSPRRLIWILAAFFALVGIDLLMRLAGFARFHHFVTRLRTRTRPAEHPGDAARICDAVDAAAAFYFKRAWCLQRSAATACLLRLRGFPAHLVIGVRRVPFLAHAWVEIHGRVVNDNPRVRDFHDVIERC